MITTVVDPALFASADSGTEINPKFFMEKVIPRMLPGEEFAVTLDKAGVAAEKGL